MDFGKIIVDGVQIADTDFSKFTRLCHLTTWERNAKTAIRVITANEDLLWSFGDYRSELIESTRDRLIDEMRAREGDCPTRNLDLMVTKSFPKEWTAADREGSPDAFNIGLNDRWKAGDILLCDFVSAEEMSNFEFAAYICLGEEECDRQGIDTLYDLFGTAFATKFYKRKQQLIAQSELVTLYEQRRELDAEIAKYELQAQG